MAPSSPTNRLTRRDVVNAADGIYDSLTAAEKVALTLQTSAAAGGGYDGVISLGVRVG